MIVEMKSYVWLINFFGVFVWPLGSQAGYVPPAPRFVCPKSSLEAQLLYPCKCTSGSDAGLYVICEETNLASLSIGLANLASLTFPVERLIITSCNFAHIYGDLFYPLKVRVMQIINTPVKTVQPLTFLGINHTLQELHIINSSLQTFPKEAFYNLGNLSVLTIDGHQIKKLEKDSVSSTSMPGQLLQLSIINGPLNELPIETLASCKKLKRLDLHNNSLTTLQRGQFKGLRDVEYLDLSFNHITKLDGTHMSDLTKMVWCNVSHNALPELTRGTFARNTVLRSLSLNHNKIRKLDSNSFRGMRLIRRLYLSDNNITDIGRGTFDTLGRIGTIDLARNQIKKIDFQMFNRLRYVEIINVSSNQVTEISEYAFKELYLVHIDLSHNFISKIEPNSFENCANITVLDLSHNNISNFAKNVFDEITYATEFQLSYNLLTDLSQVPLANMTGLKLLNVSHNQITVIPRNTFPKLYELHTIDMSHNKLSDIAISVFQVLFSLRNLFFSYNSLEEIKSGTFGTMPTLLYLDLSYNKLSKISKQAFSRMPSVQTMNVRENQLTSLFDIPQSLSHLDASHNFITFETPNKWPSMNALLSLDLSHNEIYENLVSESFSPLLTLQTLNLSYNGITIPPKDALSTLSSLRNLYMQGNEIEELDKQCFGVLPIIAELNLARNKIWNVKDSAFLGLRQLLFLDLSMNNITSINNTAFKELVALRTLDLSFNSIELLDNKTNSIFEDLLSLEKLNVSHNQISFLTRVSFPSSPWIPYHLKHLDLSYNEMPVLTYELTFGTKTLHYLNISYNLISEIRKSVLGNLTSLQVLDLSHNLLEDLSAPNVFVLPTNLTYLSLANNLLYTFPLKHIHQSNNLKHLDLRFNQLESFFNELMPMIKRGTHIYYEGNPVNCDCHLRPVRRWILSMSEAEDAWSQFHCQYDTMNFTDIPLTMLPEELLSCNNTIEEESYEYQLTPDVKFRQLKLMKDGGVITTWFVNTKTDIADFRMVVRTHRKNITGNEDILWEKLEPYNIRSDKFFTLPKNQDGLELCIEPVTSEGHSKPSIQAQCHELPYLNSASRNRLSYLLGSITFIFTIMLF